MVLLVRCFFFERPGSAGSGVSSYGIHIVEAEAEGAVARVTLKSRFDRIHPHPPSRRKSRDQERDGVQGVQLVSWFPRR